MSTVLKRVLTRKSILGFGDSSVRDLSIQMILDLGKRTLLVKSYYGLDKISFTDDILDEIGIKEEFRIEKPGKVGYLDEAMWDMVYKVNNEYYKKSSELDKIKMAAHGNKNIKNMNIRNQIARQESASSMTRRNHGHKK